MQNAECRMHVQGAGCSVQRAVGSFPSFPSLPSFPSFRVTSPTEETDAPTPT